MLPVLMEPKVQPTDPYHVPTVKNSEFKLPKLDSILDLCRSRQDFPQHLNQRNGKRRRSLVHEFLCSDFDDNPAKRPRAFSLDDGKELRTWQWNQSELQPNQNIQNQPPVNTVIGMRRHSMFEQPTTGVSFGWKKGTIRPWTVEEDSMLLACVKRLGAQWSKIAEEIEGRNRRQCKEHWYRVLSKRPCAKDVDPEKINGNTEFVQTEESVENDSSRRGLWSEDEDLQLLKAYKELGPRWPLIAARVPGRNQRQCEKRYRRIKKSQDEQEQLATPVPSTPVSANESKSASPILSLQTLAAVATQQTVMAQ
ncbi:hypothetical protein HDV01_000791 [Terramyces sp. JEL0728]|nr:hypothetical protein HDV01_000791 [Terramyces sp. JEL0728]